MTAAPDLVASTAQEPQETATNTYRIEGGLLDGSRHLPATSGNYSGRLTVGALLLAIVLAVLAVLS